MSCSLLNAFVAIRLLSAAFLISSHQHGKFYFIVNQTKYKYYNGFDSLVQYEYFQYHNNENKQKPCLIPILIEPTHVTLLVVLKPRCNTNLELIFPFYQSKSRKHLKFSLESC